MQLITRALRKEQANNTELWENMYPSLANMMRKLIHEYEKYSYKTVCDLQWKHLSLEDKICLNKYLFNVETLEKENMPPEGNPDLQRLYEIHCNVLHTTRLMTQT